VYQVRLLLFENNVLKRKFVPKREEVTVTGGENCIMMRFIMINQGR
jgi:hypothetical protein